MFGLTCTPLSWIGWWLSFSVTFFTSWPSPNLLHNMILSLECSEVIVSKCMECLLCRFMDIPEHIFNCYMVGVWVLAVKNRNDCTPVMSLSGCIVFVFDDRPILGDLIASQPWSFTTPSFWPYTCTLQASSLTINSFLGGHSKGGKCLQKFSVFKGEFPDRGGRSIYMLRKRGTIGCFLLGKVPLPYVFPMGNEPFWLKEPGR